jgi:hypothetical protein
MERREHEFFNLQPGNRTVEEYAAEFTRLSKSCPALVTAKTDRVRRFTKGLRLELKKALIGMVPATFSAAIETATRIDKLNGDRTKFQSKENLQWLNNLLYVIDLVKGATEQLIAFRKIKLYSRCDAIVVGRKDIKLMFVRNHDSSSNAKKEVQEFSIRNQE